MLALSRLHGVFGLQEACATLREQVAQLTQQLETARDQARDYFLVRQRLQEEVKRQVSCCGCARREYLLTPPPDQAVNISNLTVELEQANHRVCFALCDISIHARRPITVLRPHSHPSG